VAVDEEGRNRLSKGKVELTHRLSAGKTRLQKKAFPLCGCVKPFVTTAAVTHRKEEQTREMHGGKGEEGRGTTIVLRGSRKGGSEEGHQMKRTFIAGRLAVQTKALWITLFLCILTG